MNGITGAAVGAKCFKCGMNMTSWTSVNGNPCCDFCKPKERTTQDRKPREIKSVKSGNVEKFSLPGFIDTPDGEHLFREVINEPVSVGLSPSPGLSGDRPDKNQLDQEAGAGDFIRVSREDWEKLENLVYDLYGKSAAFDFMDRIERESKSGKV